MFNLCVNGLMNTYGGRLPYHVRVLDEAANTGQVPGLEKIVAVIRSRRSAHALFYQATGCSAITTTTGPLMKKHILLWEQIVQVSEISRQRKTRRCYRAFLP